MLYFIINYYLNVGLYLWEILGAWFIHNYTGQVGGFEHKTMKPHRYNLEWGWCAYPCIKGTVAKLGLIWPDWPNNLSSFSSPKQTTPSKNWLKSEILVQKFHILDNGGWNPKFWINIILQNKLKRRGNLENLTSIDIYIYIQKPNLIYIYIYK